MLRRPITWQPGRFAAWRLFSGGQFVGVLAWHRPTGYLALNGAWGKYDFRDAVERHVGRYGLDEPEWFEPTPPPRRHLLDEDQMAHPRTKLLPRQLIGLIIPEIPEADDLDIIADINSFRGITWASILRLFRPRSWTAGPITDLYCDGGLCGQNGSAPAGTWAFVGTDEYGRIACAQYGLFAARQIDYGHVSNNSSELAALIKALAFVPQLWAGRLNTDSECARLWLLEGDGHSEYKMPRVMRPLRNTFGKKVIDNGVEVRLVKGHASQDDLDAGVSPKNGLPTAPLNNLCDLICTAQYLRWQDQQNPEAE